MNHLTVRATAILSFLIIVMMGAVVSNQANPPIILGGPYSPGMVVVGTDLTLSISLSGDRPMSFEWQFNGLAIPGQFNEALYLRNVTYTNAGSYRVIVRNAAGSATSEAVEVTVVPFGLYISTREVFLSEFATFQLSVGSTATDPTTYQWRKDGVPLPGLTDTYLFFAPVRLSDAGKYDLVGVNRSGSVTSEVAIVNVALAPPTPTGSPQVEIAQGVEATLFANVIGSEPLSIQWFKDAVPLTAPGENPSFHIAAATLNDSGGYTVVASNSIGSVTNTAADVIVRPLTVSGPFRESGEPDYLGEAETLSVTISSSIPASLQWYFNGSALEGETNASLKISALSTNDNGEYVVKGMNGFGAVTSLVTTLNVVTSPPLVNGLLAEQTTIQGNIFLLSGGIFGGPPPAAQWRFNGVDLPGQTNGLLLLPSISAIQAGTYELVASNEFGMATNQSIVRVRPGQAFDDWRWRLPRPQGSHLKAIATGDSGIVAVGDEGNILVSTNGRDWSSITVNLDGDIRSLTYGNGIYLAYATTRPGSGNWGGAFLYRSTDAINWVAYPTPAVGQYLTIRFGAGRFIAQGASFLGAGPQFVLSSSDGISWQRVLFAGRSADAVAWTGTRFVASSGSKLFGSNNGLEWSEIDNMNAQLYQITYGNNRFAGVRFDGALVFSSDGTHWQFASSVPAYIKSISFVKDYFVLLTSDPNGSIFISSNAEVWTAVSTGVEREIDGVTFAQGQYIGVGDAGAILTATDPHNWSLQTPNLVDEYGVTQSPNLTVVAGDSGTIKTSSDGVTWTERSTPTSRNLHAVHYANGLFVAAGRRGAIITSPDGINWTSRNSGTTNYIERVAWADGRWIAACELGDIASSTDGITWTAVNTGEPLSDNEGAAYGNGMWVVVGGYFNPNAVGKIFTSTNGTNWTRSQINFRKRFRDITFGNGQFVAIGNDGIISVFSGSQVYTNVTSSGDNLRRVRFANGRFFAVGNGGTIISIATPENRASWVIHRVPTGQNFHDIVLQPSGRAVVVGNNGMVLHSGRMTPQLFLRAAAPGAILQTEPGIDPSGLVLERSADFKTWETIPGFIDGMSIPTADSKNFFRLVAP